MTKEENYKIVYQKYCDAVYKVCLYYLKDEAEAREVTLLVFLEFYDYFEEVDSEYMLGYLIHMAKEFIDNRSND